MTDPQGRPPQTALYRDPSQPVEDRIHDLLQRMTLEEKMRQMGLMDTQAFVDSGSFAPDVAAAQIGTLGIGALQDPRAAPAFNAGLVNSLQRYLCEETRLGIPALVVGECLHGHMSGDATIFPQAIGLASTWDPDLIREMATCIALEARAVGVNQALSPDLDLARDPRWGRVEETYGEDPYLTARMGVAYVRGLQGEGEGIDGEHIVATVKHYAAHGSPEGGINLAPVSTSLRQLRALYLPPFEAAIREGGALSVMPAYSEFNDVPCSSSKLLLHRILREEWGFRGYTFADYGSLHMLVSYHYTATDRVEAGKQALEAGMDMEAPVIWAYGPELLEQFRSGQADVRLVDRATSRILRVKFLAGLFEDPFAPDDAATRINPPAHRQLARRLACESMILLKNSEDVLPLSPDIRSLAVIGPNATEVQLGDYNVGKATAVPPLEGLRAAAPAGTEIRYAQGCGIWELSTDGFAEAVAAAAAADTAVLFVGGASMALAGIGWGDESAAKKASTCGEGFDRTELGLPGVQQQLVEAVVATGTPTVVVLVHGRPYSISWIAENVPAILDAWYPGEQGGHAIADVLFGNADPGGRLPVTVPRTVGQVPLNYNHKPSRGGCYHKPGAPGRPGRDYVFCSPTPLYEFGHGLSYTTFAYSDLKIEPAVMPPLATAEVSVTVTNTGSRSGSEVVQLYIRDQVSSVTTPVKVLRGFRKLRLEPGSAETVCFQVGFDDLKLCDQHMEWVVEPGLFEIRVGPLQGELQVATASCGS